MLIRVASTARTFLSAPFLVPVSLPILIVAAVVVVALLALILFALCRRDHVRTGFRLRPWSIAFFLEAEGGTSVNAAKPRRKPAPRTNARASNT
jgi:hypothetical protein